MPTAMKSKRMLTRANRPTMRHKPRDGIPIIGGSARYRVPSSSYRRIQLR
jgi:hypothetical protein